jgi:uncharacterized sulfatase
MTKTMRWLYRTSVLLTLLTSSGNAAQNQPFNLISVVTDDQAHWSIGAYGNREARTPQMDRLAREGARFLNAFTCTPVCSPSRAAFLTGRYGTQLGITDWITPKEAKDGIGLGPGSVTWPKVLQKHGYKTALIGKWHLGTRPEFHPTKHGFDHFYGFLGGGTTPMDPIFEVNGVTNKLKGAEPDLLVDDTMDFIEKNREHPFAVLLHFRSPHMPYGPVPLEDSVVFENLDPTIPDFPGLNTNQVKKWMREYYSSIHSVDRNLGRLFARLDELKLASKTIILFTSDHGYNIGHHGIHTKGNGWWVAGGKTGPKRPNMFEESIRVPLMVRWPGVVRPGTEIKEMISNIDTFATVLGMLEIPRPHDWKQEGTDFSPLLRGREMAEHEAIFGQYDLHNGGLAYMRMIRTAEWKLVRHHFTSALDEFYDLRNDPGEVQNQYDNPNREEIRDGLQKKLTAWQRAIDDPILKRDGR